MRPFDRIRASLIERGLIRKEGGDFHVTEAGNAWIDAQFAKLKRIEHGQSS